MNEFVLEMDKNFSITASAFTKARKKLKHTAYLELNDDIIDIYYRNDDIKRLRGYRILAFDGSKITLPKNKNIKKEFGTKPISNHIGKELGKYSRATFQACYDVLNNIVVKSILGRGSAYEVDQAKNIIFSLDSNDLLIFDRGYAAYPFMAKQQKYFIIRCPKIILLLCSKCLIMKVQLVRQYSLMYPTNKKESKNAWIS